MIIAFSTITDQQLHISCDCQGGCNCRHESMAPRYTRTRYEYDTATRKRLRIIDTGTPWIAKPKKGEHYHGCSATDPVEQHRPNCPCRYLNGSVEQVNALTAIALGIVEQPLGEAETPITL